MNTKNQTNLSQLVISKYERLKTKQNKIKTKAKNKTKTKTKTKQNKTKHTHKKKKKKKKNPFRGCMLTRTSYCTHIYNLNLL